MRASWGAKMPVGAMSWLKQLEKHFFTSVGGLVCLAAIVNVVFSTGGPIVWPDSIGYLRPAADHLDGLAFSHWNGRGFLYPAILAALLSIANSLNSLVAAQKVLQCVALLLVFLSIRRIQGAVPELVPRAISISISLGFAYLYLVYAFNGAAIGLIFVVMPEVCFSTLLALLIYLVVRHATGEGRHVLTLVLLITLISAAIPLVKPHFMLAALAVPAVAVCLAQAGLRRRAFCGAILGALASVPFHAIELTLQYTHDSRVSTVFGPRTLFCNNADLISRYLSSRVTSGIDEAVIGDLLGTAQAGPDAWVVNGFDGDRCMYGSAGWKVGRHFQASYRDEARYYVRTYINAALASPQMVGQRVWRQLEYLRRNVLFDHADLRVDCGPLDSSRLLNSLFDRLADQCARVSGVTMRFQHVDPIQARRAFFYFVPLALLVSIIRWLRRTASNASVRAFAMLFAAFGAINLLIAAAHSFDVWRYIVMQAPLMTCLLAAAIAVLIPLGMKVLRFGEALARRLRPDGSSLGSR